jgi:hypothetical protein
MMRQPRFCLKRGRVDWSRSPSPEVLEFEVGGARPFAGRILTPGALRQVVLDHARSLRDDPRGRRADLRGAVIEGDALRLVKAKLEESPETAELWSAVLGTAEERPEEPATASQG